MITPNMITDLGFQSIVNLLVDEAAIADEFARGAEYQSPKAKATVRVIALVPSHPCLHPLRIKWCRIKLHGCGIAKNC